MVASFGERMSAEHERGRQRCSRRSLVRGLATTHRVSRYTIGVHGGVTPASCCAHAAQWPMLDDVG